MNLREFRRKNLERIKDFKNKNGKVIRPNGIDDWTAEQWLAAVVEELGEVSEVLGELSRRNISYTEAEDQLSKEIADVFSYLDILAAKFDIDLGDAVKSKFNEVSDRIGSKWKME